MNKPVHSNAIEGSTDNPFPECFHEKMGQSVWRGLSDQFGLESMGVNLEVIKPGGTSGLKHWHTGSEEFVYVLSGQLTLFYGDDQYLLEPGMCIGFKAGEEKGHRLVNETDSDASFIVAGTRPPADRAVYDEDDFQWRVEDNGEWKAARKDGTLYSG